MPRYDYECRYCKHRWEEQRRIVDRATLSTCPSCGAMLGGQLQPSAPQFQLKGRGFHVNDYPKGPKNGNR